MVPVAGRPFLEHVLRQLAGQGFPEALLLVGYKADAIMGHFGDGSDLGIALRYSREPEPAGTGGAFRLARDLIKRQFLMLYGDLYRGVDYAALAARHQGNALAVYPYVAGLATIACANVGLNPGGGRVAMYAKDRPDLGLDHVDAGFGLFIPEVLDLLPEGSSSFEATLFPGLASQGRLGAIPVDRNFFDIGNPVDLADARKRFATLDEE
jgi:NDP-sugar pyrophosphorylase family protein